MARRSQGGPSQTRLPAEAIYERRFRGCDRQLLMLIGRHTDRDGWCRRNQSRMAAEIGVTRATVVNSIRRLKDLGWISVQHMQRDDGGNASACYQITIPASQAELAFATPPDSSVLQAPESHSESAPESTVDSANERPLSERSTSSSEEVGARADGDGKLSAWTKRDGDRRLDRRGRKRRAAPGQRALLLSIDGEGRRPGAGTRLPTDWTPTEIDYAYAHRRGLSPPEIHREAERFRNHYIAAAGERGVRADWSATWRNWVLRTVDHKREAEERRKRDPDRSQENAHDQRSDDGSPGSTATSPVANAFKRLTGSS